MDIRTGAGCLRAGLLISPDTSYPDAIMLQRGLAGLPDAGLPAGLRPVSFIMLANAFYMEIAWLLKQ